MLIVDIGNTNTKLYDTHAEQRYEIPTQDLLLDNYYHKHTQLQDSQLIVSSVLSCKHTAQIISKINSLNATVYQLSTKQIFSLIFSPQDANQLNNIGVDRALKILHLTTLGNETSISIGCGTAFTIEVVKDRQFVDSYILPGISAQKKALNNVAEQINTPDIFNLNDIFYKTETSINKGILFSYIGLIQHIITKWSPDNIIISGKYASLIQQNLPLVTCNIKVIPFHELQIIKNFAKLLTR